VVSTRPLPSGCSRSDAREIADRLLGEMAGAGDRAGSYEVDRDDAGRPWVRDDSGPRFAASVSYGQGLLAVAFATSGHVGVDVQRIEPVVRLPEIVSSYFSADAAEELAAASGDERDERFIAIWTLFEALGKTRGTGIDGFEAPGPLSLANGNGSAGEALRFVCAHRLRLVGGEYALSIAHEGPAAELIMEGDTPSGYAARAEGAAGWAPAPSPSRESGVLPTFEPIRPAQQLDPATFIDAATDMPSSAPARRLRVRHAGVAGQHAIFTIEGFAGPAPMTVSAEVDAGVPLPADRRGAHMSRVVDAIATASDRRWDTLTELLGQLSEAVAGAQGLSDARVSLSGTTVIDRTTPVSGRRSPDRFRLLGEATRSGENVAGWVALEAAVVTACPCTLAYSSYETVLHLADEFGLEQANAIGGRIRTYTHSQRGILCVRVGMDDDCPLGAAYSAMSRGAHLVHDLLKRPDEHDLVRRAHERPQFTEDVVRNVAAEVVTELGAHPDRWVSVSCRNLESIHAHDVESVVEGTVGELAGQLRGEC
jgi:GTP cyclohydrolase FolE2